MSKVLLKQICQWENGSQEHSNFMFDDISAIGPKYVNLVGSCSMRPPRSNPLEKPDPDSDLFLLFKIFEKRVGIFEVSLFYLERFFFLLFFNQGLQ